jgi:hypothetical protein
VKVLFDQGTPAPLRHSLREHDIVTAFERGWQALQNGELLRTAEAEGFAAIITTDKNLRYQQNLADRRLSIVVLMTTDWRFNARSALCNYWNCSDKECENNKGRYDRDVADENVRHSSEPPLPSDGPTLEFE